MKKRMDAGKEECMKVGMQKSRDVGSRRKEERKKEIQRRARMQV